MAILKHVAGKSADYGAALDYLKYEHDEVLKKPLLDANGNWVLRRDILLDGINCEPELFDVECEMLNAQYNKNQNYDEIKTHHYLISFDPADKDECGLTGERAQAIGMEYVETNFPGHQALVCTHMDGHNGSGNIHVHIVINSLRKLDVPQKNFMERPIDCKAGYKHHLTKDYLKHLQQSLMNICMRENLNQVDLLSPSVNKITQQEYYAKQRGQINLDKLNAELVAEGFTPMRTKFQTEKDKLRDAITAAAKRAKSFEESSVRPQTKHGYATRSFQNTLPQSHRPFPLLHRRHSLHSSHGYGTRCFASLQKTKHNRCCRPLNDCPDQIPCEAARYLPRKASWEKECALHGKVLLPVP